MPRVAQRIAQGSSSSAGARTTPGVAADENFVNRRREFRQLPAARPIPDDTVSPASRPAALGSPVAHRCGGPDGRRDRDAEIHAHAPTSSWPRPCLELRSRAESGTGRTVETRDLGALVGGGRLRQRRPTVMHHPPRSASSASSLAALGVSPTSPSSATSCLIASVSVGSASPTARCHDRTAAIALRTDEGA